MGRSPDLTQKLARHLVHRPPLTEGGQQSLLSPPASTPFLRGQSGPTNAPRRRLNTAEGRSAHGRHTRQRTGRRRRRSEPGTSRSAWSAPGAPRGPQARRAHTKPVREGHVTRHINPTLPRLGGRRAKRTTHMVGGAGTTESPARLTGTPTNRSQECGGLSQGSDRITAPLPATHHRLRWGGETRGPLAEREERPPFAMNVRPSPGAA